MTTPERSIRPIRSYGSSVVWRHSLVGMGLAIIGITPA